MTEREAIHSNQNITTLARILVAKWGLDTTSRENAFVRARYMADHAYNEVTAMIFLGAVQAELNLQY